MEPKLKKSVLFLVIALVVVFAFSWLAQGFNSSFGQVKVSRIYFDTDKGRLSGLLYLPKGAGADSPRPGVVLTHGYLNSAEMQDANAIELSRRGHAVLALDMYDHGHSVLDADKTGNFFAFWPTAIYDAVQYFYQQPYVLKDEAGNGIIGVTGHSMGGFSSTTAIYLDEQDFKASGIRKIAAGLTHGSDYMWTSYLAATGVLPAITPQVLVENAGGRTLGMLAAQFDEFFFNADDAPEGSVRKKNFVATPSAQAFLEQAAPSADTWYDTADGGKRIVYQPYEIHPWNHFSMASTGHTVDFYAQAFKAHEAALQPLPAGNQTWIWKEIFELVALIGFVLMFVPLISLLRRLPFFKLAKTGSLTPRPDGKFNPLRLLLLVVGILLPAIVFPAVMDKKLDGTFLMVFKWVGLALAILGLGLAVFSQVKKQQGRGPVPGILLLLAGAALFGLLHFPTFLDSPTYPAPTTNSIVFWALISGLMSLVMMVLVYLLFLRKEGVKAADYGLKAGPVAILASLATALVAFAAGYGLVFLLDALFVTDLRIWVFAFKTFESSILPIALRYLPFFFVFDLISGISIVVNTNTEKLKGLRGYCRAIALNAGGIIIYLIAHYGLLFLTGTALFPTQHLSSILLFGFVPVLVIAGVFTRALYKRDGNVWTAAFLNALLMTLVTVANTTVYFQR